MSAKMTSTCWPRSNARYSATVSAMRGVRMRWTTGSSAVSRNRARSPEDERLSRTSRIAAASACGRPMAATTTLNGSPAAFACAPIWAASSRCGRPAEEKTGSFCPRTSVVSASTIEIPVRIGSRGTSRAVGLIGAPLTGRIVAASIGGPSSSGSPMPFQTRPSHPSPTGISSGRPSKADMHRAGIDSGRALQ